MAHKLTTTQITEVQKTKTVCQIYTWNVSGDWAQRCLCWVYPGSGRRQWHWPSTAPLQPDLSSWTSHAVFISDQGGRCLQPEHSQAPLIHHPTRLIICLHPTVRLMQFHCMTTRGPTQPKVHTSLSFEWGNLPSVLHPVYACPKWPGTNSRMNLNLSVVGRCVQMYKLGNMQLVVKFRGYNLR